MKLGLIVFANNSGLGNQTRRLAYMLKPDRVLVINSTGFSKNKEHNIKWYKDFNGYTVDGFPTNKEINVFLGGLTHVLVAENPLNFHLLDRAKQLGIKVYIQSNYEFCDHLLKPYLTLPHLFLMPSYWHLRTMKEKFGDNTVMYLPPPIDPYEFKTAREINLNRDTKIKRFLHIVGTLAVEDRNGTLDLLNALKYSEQNYELVIRSQHKLPETYIRSDKRIKYITENVENVEDMYKDFDALILPRRYGGLSLTTNEALMSGLPVIMPDISPNNELLPEYWLVPTTDEVKELFTRTMIDVYSTNLIKLAEKIDEFAVRDLAIDKIGAVNIAYNEFSINVLSEKYNQLWLQ